MRVTRNIMALSDWELIFGSMGALTTTHKVHGQKALYMDGWTNRTGLVHKQTYNDAPLNVRIDTWIFREIPNDGDMSVYVGGLARVNKQANAYYEWYLDQVIESGGLIYEAYFKWAAKVGDQQKDGGTIEVTSILQDHGLDDWSRSYWRWVRAEGYESGGKFHVSIAMTPNVGSPDVDNPTVSSLVLIASASMDIPTELSNGGGCGLVVGCSSYASDGSGAEIIDYTQIYY